MKPSFEKIPTPVDASWSMLNRRLPDDIPFEWHHHPEYELTLTLNSRGHRYVSSDVRLYDDGDLVLLGPNVPHSWCSAERIDPDQPHVALVIWFSQAWAQSLVSLFPGWVHCKRCWPPLGARCTSAMKLQPSCGPLSRQWWRSKGRSDWFLCCKC